MRVGTHREPHIGSRKKVANVVHKASSMGIVRRWGGIFSFLGAILIFAPMWIHPPTYHPYSPGETFHIIAAAAPHWAGIHWLFIPGGLCVALGMMTLHHVLQERGQAYLSLFAVACMVATIPLWTAVVTFEAAGWPGVAATFASLAPGLAEAELVLLTLGRAIWAANLALAYVVAGLVAVAMVFWGVDLLRAGLFPAWFGRGGIVLGIVSPLVLIAAWNLPDVAPWMFAPVGTAVFTWMMALGWLLWVEDEG